MAGGLARQRGRTCSGKRAGSLVCQGHWVPGTGVLLPSRPQLNNSKRDNVRESSKERERVREREKNRERKRERERENRV